MPDKCTKAQPMPSERLACTARDVIVPADPIKPQAHSCMTLSEGSRTKMLSSAPTHTPSDGREDRC